jgi:TPR repeat protein
VPNDDGLAVTWYRQAAIQGDPFAQNNLGDMYASGRGVPESKAEAIKWFRRAAEQGNEIAKKNLEIMGRAR